MIGRSEIGYEHKWGGDVQANNCPKHHVTCKEVESLVDIQNQITSLKRLCVDERMTYHRPVEFLLSRDKLEVKV